MAQPTSSDVHVNALLSDLSLLYMQEQKAFIATEVFPTLPVSKKSDLYTTFSRADMTRNLMRKRGPGAESAGGGYKVDTEQSYLCNVWALHKDIDDQTRANADSVFNLDAEATRFLVAQASISREIDWANNFFNDTTWTTNWSGVSSAPTTNQILYWDNPNSQPIIDVRNLKRTVQIASLYRPNKMVLARPVFDVLCDHPDFIDRVKYGQTAGKPAEATLDVMAQLFELDQVLVMDAIYNTSPELAGQDSGATYAAPAYNAGINAGENNVFVAGNDVLLIYTPSAPGLLTPGAGYTFAWTSMFGATAAGSRMLSFYMNWTQTTRVEIEMAYAHKAVGVDMGAFISNAIS